MTTKMTSSYTVTKTKVKTFKATEYEKQGYQTDEIQ